MLENTDLPSALEFFDQVAAEFDAVKPAFFLDFDGTLSPIVEDPDRAVLSAHGREILQKLSAGVPVVIVSGRDLLDVKSKIGLENLYYAGSHGYDISGPDNFSKIYTQAAEMQPVFDKAENHLTKHLSHLPKVRIERKRYAIAVHYRTAGEAAGDEVKRVAKNLVEHEPQLKTGGGKMIVELKPNFNWHKGKAILWLLERLSATAYKPIYIGDDLTDEDAFEEIRSTGIGILVGSHGSETKAKYSLKDVDEVESFLLKFHAYLQQQ